MTSELRNVFIERLLMKLPKGRGQRSELTRINSWRLKLAIRKPQCLPTPDMTSELRDIFIETHLMKMPEGRNK